MGENSVCLRPPPSPLGDAVDTLEVLINDEERDCFYASLDQLPDFDTRVASDDGQYGYTIDEEDWQWLATAVGTKSTQELVQFAHDEHERMALNDPDLVRPPNLCIFSFRSLFFRNFLAAYTRMPHGGQAQSAAFPSPPCLRVRQLILLLPCVLQAELASLGAATAEALCGEASLEEQLAACQELTRFAEHFEVRTRSLPRAAALAWLGGPRICHTLRLPPSFAPRTRSQLPPAHSHRIGRFSPPPPPPPPPPLVFAE